MLNVREIEKALALTGMDVEVKEQEVTKSSDKYEAFVLREVGYMVGACIDKRKLEGLSDLDALEEIIKEAARLRARNNEMRGLLDSIADYEATSRKLFLKAVNKDKGEYFDDKLFRSVADDINLVVALKFSDTASADVTTSVLDVWGVDENTIFDRAVINTIDNISISPMELAIKEMLGMSADTKGVSPYFDVMGLNIITSTDTRHGAAGAFLTEKLAEIAWDIDDDIVILPSSVHECLLLARTGGVANDLDSLLAMVTEINAAEVAPEDKLADNIYLYSKATNTIKSYK